MYANMKYAQEQHKNLGKKKPLLITNLLLILSSGDVMVNGLYDCLLSLSFSSLPFLAL